MLALGAVEEGGIPMFGVEWVDFRGNHSGEGDFLDCN